MTTKQIIKQMEKEFDELFVGEKSYPRKGLYTERIRVFYKDFFRTLLESFGEEVIDIAQKHHNVAKDETDKGWCDHCSCLVTVLHEQRLKVKEILQNIT